MRYKCPRCRRWLLQQSKEDDTYYCWTKIGGCGAKFDTIEEEQNPEAEAAEQDEPILEETELDDIDFVDTYFRQQLSTLDKDAKVELLRQRYRTDLYALCCEVLGMEDLRLNPKLFRRMARWATTWQPKKYVKLLLAPRGFFKTSICNEGLCIQEIINNPQATILNGRSNQENAEGTVKAIRGYLQDNRVLRFLYPEIRPGKPWATDKFSVKRPVDTQACTMEAWGTGASQTSLHYGNRPGALALVLDDMEDDKTSASEVTRAQSKQDFYYCFHLLNPGGRVIIIGTRYPVDDLYGWIMDNDEIKDKIDCLIIPAEDEDRNPIFPQRFPDEILSMPRGLNFWLYSSQMLQKPVRRTNAVFPKELIETAYFDSETVDTRNMTSGFMWDPGVASDLLDAWKNAQQRKTRGTGFSLTVGYKDHKDNLYVTHAYRRKFDPLAQINFVLDKIRELQPMYVLIEAEVCQPAFISWLREKRDKLREKGDVQGSDFSIRPVTSKKKSKEHRIDQMAALMDSGKIRIARGLTTLVEEMVEYPDGKFRDCLDGTTYMATDLPRASASREEILAREKEAAQVKVRVPKGDVDISAIFDENESLTEDSMVAAGW